MIDHFNLPVSDIDKSREFYEAVLESFGYSILLTEADVTGFGRETWLFGIVQEMGPIPPIHFAFKAKTHDEVQSFYRAALALGARSNGAPGYRVEYGPTYYSAYILDPDGHNVEAVCRGD